MKGIEGENLREERADVSSNPINIVVMILGKSSFYNSIVASREMNGARQTV
jgi:hypothetical protein